MSCVNHLQQILFLTGTLANQNIRADESLEIISSVLFISQGQKPGPERTSLVGGHSASQAHAPEALASGRLSGERPVSSVGSDLPHFGPQPLLQASMPAS